MGMWKGDRYCGLAYRTSRSRLRVRKLCGQVAKVIGVRPGRRVKGTYVPMVNVALLVTKIDPPA